MSCSVAESGKWWGGNVSPQIVAQGTVILLTKFGSCMKCSITLPIPTIFPDAGSSKREISGNGKKPTSHASQLPKRQRTLTGGFKSNFPFYLLSLQNFFHTDWFPA